MQRAQRLIGLHLTPGITNRPGPKTNRRHPKSRSSKFPIIHMSSSLPQEVIADFRTPIADLVLELWSSSMCQQTSIPKSKNQRPKTQGENRQLAIRDRQ